MPHYVYLIECQDNSIYTGYTNDLDRRIEEHKTASSKSAKYVQAKGFNKLLYAESFETKVKAMQREAQIKKLTRQNKLDLIKEAN